MPSLVAKQALNCEASDVRARDLSYEAAQSAMANCVLDDRIADAIQDLANDIDEKGESKVTGILSDVGKALNDLAKTIGDTLGSIVWGWVVIAVVFLVVGFFVLKLFLGGGGGAARGRRGILSGHVCLRRRCNMHGRRCSPHVPPSAPPPRQQMTYAPAQIPPPMQNFTPRGVYGKL